MTICGHEQAAAGRPSMRPPRPLHAPTPRWRRARTRPRAAAPKTEASGAQRPPLLTTNSAARGTAHFRVSIHHAHHDAAVVRSLAALLRVRVRVRSSGGRGDLGQAARALPAHRIPDWQRPAFCALLLAACDFKASVTRYPRTILSTLGTSGYRLSYKRLLRVVPNKPPRSGIF